jgi:hypothetical protein
MAFSQGMQDQTYGAMLQAGIQGAQHTNDQELAQRQALFQNLKAATNDSEWIMQHFPQFASWTPTGSTSAGYQPGSNAPMMAPRNDFKVPSQGGESKGNQWSPMQQQGGGSQGTYISNKPDYSQSGYVPQSSGGLAARYASEESSGGGFSSSGMTSSGMGWSR